MKRIWIWLLCIALAFSLTACNGCNETNDPSADPNASAGESTDPTDESNTTESGDTTGNDTANGGDTTTESDSTTTGNKTENDGTTGGKDSTTGKVTGDSTTASTQSGSATKTQSGSTTTGTTKTQGSSTGTTKKTESPASDNIVDWGEIFGTETTDPAEPTKSTTTTTTTTTQPTTTTTVKPTETAGVKFPAVGTDVDVKKQKGRYRISDIELDGNKLTITIKNDNKTWINQETDWVKYACYDKDGNELKGEGQYYGYLYIGAMAIGSTYTETITLPAGTVEVKLVDSEIVYWTDWK